MERNDRVKLRTILLTVLVLVTLAACGRDTTPDTSDPAEPDAAVPGDGTAEQPTAALTATPASPAEIVLCTGPRPDALYGEASAAGVLALASPQAVIFGDDYEADGSELLAELPSVGAGTLHRNDDGTLLVTLRYRDDLVWSDGEPFTAEDAALGFSLPAPSGLAPADPMLDVRQVDDYTLEVTLADTAEYPYVPVQPPLPSHVLGSEIDPAALTDAMFLSPALGPYVLASDDGSTLTFEANPNHPAAGSYPQTATVRFLPDSAQVAAEVSAGSCDVALGGSLDAADLSALGEASVYSAPGQIGEEIILNTYSADSGRPAYFADARVRQAVIQAVDRAALAASLWGDAASVSDSWIPANHWAYGGDALVTYTADPAAAGALLDEAGWRDEDGDGIREYHGANGTYACNRGEWTLPDGIPLAPTLILPEGDALRQQIAERVASDLMAVGVQVQVRTVPPDTLYSASGPLVQRGFDMALLASLTRPDPVGVSRWVGADIFLHPQTLQPVHRWQLEDRWLDTPQMVEQLAYSNIPGTGNAYQGQNYSGWCSEDANSALVSAEMMVMELADRQPLYAQQQAIFTQAVPVVPLFQRPVLAASQPDVCGIALGPVDPVTWNITEWTYSEGGCAE